MTRDTAPANAAFHRLLLRSVFLPSVVLAVLAIALILQVQHLTRSTDAVEHTDEVISRAYQLEKTLIDLQAGVRGFIITKDEAYLEPYHAGLRELPSLFFTLRALTSDRSQAQQHVSEVDRLSKLWLESAQTRIVARRADDMVTLAESGYSNGLMNQVRAEFKAFLNEETQLRDERNASTRTVARWTIFGAGGLTLLTGVLLSLLSRGQLRWLSQTYEGALMRSRELSESLELRVADRTRELEAANHKLNEANQELEAFAYSVSHDLRAPMRHISGFANLLKTSTNGSLGADDLENLNTIQQTAVVAGRMVDDLLAFSRVGRSQLRNDAIDTNAIVAATVRELAPDIGRRQIRWDIGDLPPMQGDKSLIRLVIQNLISNAVKYTSPRDVAEIAIGSNAESGGTTYWIKDNGVGFDMAYAHKLFGVFQRLHRAEEFEGTGIGLANVRRIITRHGGRVWAEGMPDAGATFFFFLPGAVARATTYTAETGAHQ